MMGSLGGKIALVTGGSRGIGRAIALQLSQRGALVAVHYGAARDSAAEVVEEIKAMGGQAFMIGADLSDMASIAPMFEALDAELASRGLSGLDILVNNAGMGGGSSLAEVTNEAMDYMIAVNFKAPVLITQEASSRLRNGGRVISLASMVAFAAYPPGLVYAMTKAAIVCFTRSLAMDWGSRGITVNAIAPGATSTDLLKFIEDDPEMKAHYASAAVLGRLGTPDDIANAVTFLASPEGGWITGQTLQVSGGIYL